MQLVAIHSHFSFQNSKKSLSLSVSPFLTCRVDIMTLPLFTNIEKYAILWSWNIYRTDKSNIKLIKTPVLIFSPLSFKHFICLFIWRKVLQYLTQNQTWKMACLHGKLYKTIFFIIKICLCSALVFSNILFL